MVPFALHEEAIDFTDAHFAQMLGWVCVMGGKLTVVFPELKFDMRNMISKNSQVSSALICHASASNKGLIKRLCVFSVSLLIASPGHPLCSYAGLKAFLYLQ